jgi:FixJ family two-component response regulator
MDKVQAKTPQKATSSGIINSVKITFYERKYPMIAHPTNIPTADIIVVDDTIEDLKLIATILEGRGFQTRLFSEGSIALRSAHMKPPAMFLLDVFMPDLDGYTLCKQIKQSEQTQDIPVMFISAGDEAKYRAKGFQSGGCDYITKPLHMEEVQVRVATQLAISQFHQYLQEQNRLLQEQLRCSMSELTHVTTNLHVRQERERRQRSEREKEALMDIIKDQQAQLQTMTDRIMQSGQAERYYLYQNTHQHIIHNIALLRESLDAMHVLHALLEQTESSGQFAEHLQASAGLLDNTHALLSDFMQDANESPPSFPQQYTHKDVIENLTLREREILQLLVDGASNSMIADRLTITTKTVYTYRARIMQKLGVTSFADLVKFAIRHNITSL